MSEHGQGNRTQVSGEGRCLARNRQRQDLPTGLSAKERTVRIRVADAKAFITIKGPTVGATRSEYEYEIPFGEGNAMLETLAEKPLIEKTRYRIPVGNLTWEIDEFLGENAGLIVAEVELKSEDQTFDKPLWVGDEVTNDPRYFNANLVKNPFTRW
jgi:adenylate cyclase